MRIPTRLEPFSAGSAASELHVQVTASLSQTRTWPCGTTTGESIALFMHLAGQFTASSTEKSPSEVKLSSPPVSTLAVACAVSQMTFNTDACAPSSPHSHARSPRYCATVKVSSKRLRCAARRATGPPSSRPEWRCVPGKIENCPLEPIDARLTRHPLPEASMRVMPPAFRQRLSGRQAIRRTL